MNNSKIIIYDANCKFCTRFAYWCTKKRNDFAILSVRDGEAKNILRNLGIKFIDLQTVHFIEKKTVFVRSKAILKILSNINYPWKLIQIFEYLPVNITDYFYKLFAKYRYLF